MASGTRFDRDYMELVLATDFIEFGRSGRSYDRDAVMAMTGDSIPVRLRLAEDGGSWRLRFHQGTPA